MVSRPHSVVSGRIAAIGFIAALVTVLLGSRSQAAPAWIGLAALFAYSIPIIVLELALLKVHRRATTGLDWSLWPRDIDLQRVSLKLAGLTATLVALILIHATVRFYPVEQMRLFGLVCLLVLPVAMPLIALYVIVVDRVMTDPRDGYYNAGLLLVGRLSEVDRGKLREHVLAWTIKGFFLPIMLVYLIGNIDRLQTSTAYDLVSTTLWLTSLVAALELVVVCVGYTCTLRLLDSHIRSANPLLWGWVVTLACYEPFNRVVSGSTLNYDDGLSWYDWFAATPVLMAIWAGLLMVSFAVWLWATVAFGLRWSNLTHRGVITHGPYRWCKHPDYFAKSVFFWLIHVPFLTTGTPAQAMQACALLLAINAIYFGRAKAEERHLIAVDPDYVAYSAFIAQHGLLARLRRLAAAAPISRPRRTRIASLAGLTASLGAILLLNGPLAATPTSWNDVPNAVFGFMQREHLPGAVLAIGRVGEQPALYAFGLADIDTQEPMSPEKRFRLASLSKPITAAAALQLVKDGYLTLDEPLAPRIGIGNAADPRFADISLRHLLSHLGGWHRLAGFDPVYDERIAEKRLGLPADADCETVARSATVLPLESAPGTSQAYSNLGYCMASLAIEAISGETYASYVRHAVLEPLSAAGLRLGEDAADLATVVQHYGHARGRLPHDAREEARLLRYGAAGGWTGTAADYFRFASAIPAAQAATKPEGLPLGEDFYGLGWRVWEGRDGPTLTHSGFMEGAFSSVFRFPNGLVVVALFNGDVEGDGIDAFDRLFASLNQALGREPQ